MIRGASLIARIALEHPERPVREVLAALVAQQKTIAGVARALGESRPSVRAALDAFGLREALPVGSEAHAEATRHGLAAKREATAKAPLLCEGSGKLAEGRHETATAAICPWCHLWCAIARGILDERPVFAEHEPREGEHERIAKVRPAVGAAHPIGDLGAQTVVMLPAAPAEDEGPAVARAVLCAAYWAAHAKGVRGVRGAAAVALVHEVANQATVGAEGALRWLEMAQQNGSHHDQLLIAINLAENTVAEEQESGR